MIRPETLALLAPPPQKKRWPHPARQTFETVRKGAPGGMCAYALEPPSEEEGLPSEVTLPADLGPVETLRTLARIFGGRFSVHDPLDPASFERWPKPPCTLGDVPPGADLVIYVQNDYD